MTKWDYIRMISERGNAYGANNGILDLLKWCDKPNTISVTEEEARVFWENPNAAPPAVQEEPLPV